MTGTTHAAAGVCAAMALSAPVGGVVLAGLGGLLCDVDCATSTLGKKVSWVSKLFEHRALTHSLLFFAVCFFLNIWLGLGVATHILLDMMTAKGVKLLWPLDRKVRLPLAKINSTDSVFEKVFRFVLIAIIVIRAFLDTGIGYSQFTDIFSAVGSIN